MTARETLEAELAAVLGAHLPKERHDDETDCWETYCSCGGWEGDYFAQGEAGPFDAHLAAVLAPVVEARSRVHADEPETPQIGSEGFLRASEGRATYPKARAPLTEAVLDPANQRAERWKRRSDEAHAKLAQVEKLLDRPTFPATSTIGTDDLRRALTEGER